MSIISAIAWWGLLSCSVFLASAEGQQSAPDPSLSSAPPLTSQSRLTLLRILDSDLVYVRVLFPKGKTGLKLEKGVVTPRGESLTKLIAAHGAAAKPGDLVHISDIIFKNRSIFLEINGGPPNKERWYERIEVGSGGGQGRPIEKSTRNPNSQGSFVEVVFDRPLPDMTPDQLKKILDPVFDFKSKSSSDAYIESAPPKVKEALKNHVVLVGMNSDMVLAAKGQPNRRIRDTDGGTEYEEWIYGEPPAEVLFVRFVGDEVVKIETITVDGKKIVKTDKEVDSHSDQETEKGTQPK